MAGISSLANLTLNPLAQAQYRVAESVNRLSSGLQINSAADNPSGLAIYESLTAQASGFQTGAGNAAEALSATNTAQGATQTSAQILQNLGTLAIAAANDFASPAQRAALQAQAGQEVQQLGTIAQNTNFNGVALLGGAFSGTTQATPSSAQVTTNDLLLGGGTVVQPAAVTVAAGTPAETVQIQIINNGGVAQAQVNAVNSQTGAILVTGTFAPGTTVTTAGTTFTLGAFTTSDAGQTATIQVNPGTAFAAGNPATVQTGASEGATTALTFPAPNAATLGVGNLDFATTLNATNAQGSINQALGTLGSAQAALGAQSTALEQQISFNNVEATNLSASATEIAGANIPQETTNFASSQTQTLITLQVLQNANAEAGFLSAFFNKAA
ncbi:MAG: flagellin [Candidatus Eremiobacteraeota bacterium]|nr:flagellin [Candidatus Eremiobacteraeota bacterium]